MIWVNCCHKEKNTSTKDILLQYHNLVDVSPFEILSTMTGFELIFIEIQDSQSNGFKLLRTIKQRFPDVKIVIVYHDLDAELAVSALRAGAEDILSSNTIRQKVDACLTRLHTHDDNMINVEDISQRELSILPALTIIDKDISAPLREEELASACQFSSTYFSRLFHNIMGVTLKQYIIKKRLDLACGLLSSDQEKISAVASSAGFKDVSYFSRVFKKHIGCSPGEFRASRQKK
ncbi:AraC family transcriptional regulator [Photobacterium angustum]|uniref:AraC family transcriptional regulator n=1 Tax=Photobacterium angustum TaxID=661 RepID=UPI0005DBD6FE|nr:AraC family transcriptional regulator [Photobacterium angustum]KJG07829.1 AraC family transcriptional regulator [Photobacterium angustum]PSV94762.1 DNA-binding response regulator [Photobacterium angustum]